MSCFIGACSPIGPETVPRDRIGYARSIATSWKEQTLLNIVKLRYADVPTFLEVTQVIAGYQLQSAISGGFNLGNNTAGIVGPITASGGAAAASTYTDRPTIIYSPLTGVDFLKNLMTPIPPSSLLFLLQSGYAASRILPIILDSINGLNNAALRFRRPADPRFSRLVTLMQDAQTSGALHIRIERPKKGLGTSLIVFPPNQNPKLAAKASEIRRLLHLKPGLQELKVYYGGYSGRDDEIDMATRSMLQIMLEFAAMVRVPRSDVSEGRATPGLTEATVPGLRPPQPLDVHVANRPPKHPYVAVRYDGRWFWIDDTDIGSKATFSTLMLLFSISETGIKGSVPVVTVPTGQ